MYSKKALDIFRKPKNIGEIKNADGIGKVGNPACGDIMWVYIKVKKDKKGNETIQDIKVKTFGCVAAVVTSSELTDMIKGKTIEEAMKLAKKDLIEKVGGLPQIKHHCSVLAVDAFHKAIEDYRKKTKA